MMNKGTNPDVWGAFFFTHARTYINFYLLPSPHKYYASDPQKGIQDFFAAALNSF